MNLFKNRIILLCATHRLIWNPFYLIRLLHWKIFWSKLLVFVFGYQKIIIFKLSSWKRMSYSVSSIIFWHPSCNPTDNIFYLALVHILKKYKQTKRNKMVFEMLLLTCFSFLLLWYLFLEYVHHFIITQMT